MIEDAKQKARVMELMSKRRPGNFEACPKRKCPGFDIIEVAPGMVMYFCTVHNYSDNVVVQ